MRDRYSSPGHPRYRARATAAMAAMLGLAFGGAALAAGQAAEPQVTSNVVYGTYSGLALLMDVKRPARPNGFALVHIPGSGFQAPLELRPFQIKDPEWQLPVERPFLEAGFTVFTINHRAAPRFKYPAAVEDAQRAVRFVREHAANYGVSADWIGLYGASSGGHLVNLLGTLGEGTESGIQPAAEQPRKPQCIVSVMSSSDLLPLGQDGLAVSLVTNWLDVPAPFPEEEPYPGYQERLRLYREASPVTHVRQPLPRFRLFHGDQDKLVPASQSETFRDALRKAGGEVELTVMPGVGHAFPSPYREQAAEWMSRCLAATRPAR